MNKILIILSFVILASCGVSQKEKENVAAVTCSIMGETRNMDAAVRVREMNDAREKIGGEPFLDGDDAIQEAFEYGLCQELVLDDSYNEILQRLKDAKRERERLAREKRAEEARIMAEKRKIAAEKRAEEEEAQRMQPLKEKPIPTFVPKPEYPSRAINQNIDGYGLVRFNITESGDVTWEVLLEEWPEGLGFGESALRAAKNLKYEERGAPIQGVRYKFLFKREK